MTTIINNSIILIIVICSLIYGPPAEAQSGCTPPATRAWIKVEDNRGQNDTLWFGFDPAATCSVETGFCEVAPLEICGPPTNLACYYWLIERCGSQLDEAVWKHNYRELKPEAQIDTFTLCFAGEYPITFSWSPDSVMKIADSIIVTDGITFNLFRFRMDLQNSFIVSSFHRILNIFTYRNGITDVAIPNENTPASFEIKQNYPNPFNPTTNFEFQIANRGFVTLKVFNVLGEEIATILSEELQPGQYARSWDASTVAGGLSSGVYYYRLTTQNSVETKKMIYLE